MKNDIDFKEAVKRIQLKDDRFHEDLYYFIMQALEYTYFQMGERRHVSAEELIKGLCAFAKEVQGIMALTFLNKWGIRSTADVGDAVFYLIEEGVLAKREGEMVEDFENLLDLREVLEERYFS